MGVGGKGLIGYVQMPPVSNEKRPRRPFRHLRSRKSKNFLFKLKKKKSLSLSIAYVRVLDRGHRIRQILLDRRSRMWHTRRFTASLNTWPCLLCSPARLFRLFVWAVAVGVLLRRKLEISSKQFACWSFDSSFFVLELICGGMCELRPFFSHFFSKVLIANGSSDCFVALWRRSCL